MEVNFLFISYSDKKLNPKTNIPSRYQISKTIIKMIRIVRAFWMIYKCVFIALWSTKMTWAMWLTFSELWEFTVHASCIVCLLVKTENNDFIKELNDVVLASIACWKRWQSLWEFSSRWKPSIASWVFTDLLSNSPKRLHWFSPSYEGMENMFYFLSMKCQIIFSCYVCILKKQ